MWCTKRINIGPVEYNVRIALDVSGVIKAHGDWSLAAAEEPGAVRLVRLLTTACGNDKLFILAKDGRDVASDGRAWLARRQLLPVRGMDATPAQLRLDHVRFCGDATRKALSCAENRIDIVIDDTYEGAVMCAAHVSMAIWYSKETAPLPDVPTNLRRCDTWESVRELVEGYCDAFGL